MACAPTAFSSYADDGGAGAMLLRSEDHGEWTAVAQGMPAVPALAAR